MNIFWLDEDVELSARYHCDKHVTKMCVEYAQILSTSADRHGFWQEDKMYKPIPRINPVIQDWAAESLDNFTKLCRLAMALGREFEHRYGHKHKSIVDVVSKIDLSKVPVPDRGWTDPPMCPRHKVDDYGVNSDDYIHFYRMLYSNHKNWAMMWTNREVPQWYRDMGGRVRGEH